MSSVTVNVIQREHIIDIDLDCFTWGDALKLREYKRKAAKGEISDEDAIRVINEFVAKVTGQDPLMMPSRIVTKVIQAMTEAGEPDPNSESG